MIVFSSTIISKVLYMLVNRVLFPYEHVSSVYLNLGLLDCCSLNVYQKITKSVMKLSISRLQNYKNFVSLEE